MMTLLGLAVGWKIGLSILIVALGAGIGFLGLLCLLVVGAVPMWLFFNLTGGESIVFVMRKDPQPFLNRQITKPLTWCSVFILLLSALWLSSCTLGPAEKRPPGKSVAQFHSDLKAKGWSFWERNPWIPFSMVAEGFHEAR